jgi:hypothetical protein
MSPNGILSLDKKAKLIIAFDIDNGKKPELSFVKRFARENTNDNGEKLSLRSAEVVVRQFKIYMIGVLDMLINEPSKVDGLNVNPQSPYIRVPFMPPLLISRVWDLFMTYTERYLLFCSMIYGSGKILTKNYDQNKVSQYNYYKKF